METKWLDWARRLQAIAQTGLHYSNNQFDIERFESIRQISAEIISEHTNLECTIEDIVNLFGQQEGYATPKVDTRAAVFRDGNILLVKERIDHKWTLPGGWADVCSSPKENSEREVWEESGFEVKATKLAAIYDRELRNPYPPMPFHVYKLFFICEIIRGEATISNETEAVEFFDEHNLPELSMGRVTHDQIHRMFAHYRNPNLPTEFE